MAKKIPAKIIAEFLKRRKVQNVFDVAGGMIAYIEDSISRAHGIECTPCRHEQGCGFSAEGYSRVSQNIGVAMATSGPGATNLITPIASCFFDSVPALFITGQVNTESLRSHPKVRQLGFQETDIVSIVKPITKYSTMVVSTDRVIFELEKAVFLAQSGRPGPVLLDIPINIQRTEVEEKSCPHFFGSPEHRRLIKQNSKSVPDGAIARLQKLFKKSKAPLVLVGGGIRGSKTTKEIIRFVEKNNLPVVTSLMGLDSFPGTHKNFVGFIGSYGARHANIVMANADVIISLGSRLDVRQTGDAGSFAKQSVIVHVDIDPYSIGHNVRSDFSIVASLREFFKAASGVKTAVKPAWQKFIMTVKKEFAYTSPYKKQIDPNVFLADLSEAAKPSAIITSDVGNHQMWLAQSWTCHSGQRVLFSGGLGSMGFGLPAALGAHFAAPRRQNILVCGDGGFQMNLQELETMRHHKIPLKIFLLNNESLGMVREFQDFYFKKNYQSTVIGYSHPDFAKIAAAFDLAYVKIFEPGGQKQQIRKVLNSRGAVLVEVNLRMLTKMEPKIIYGHALDDQYPFLSKSRKAKLERLKAEFKLVAAKEPV